MRRKTLKSNPIVYWTNESSGPCLVLLHPACCDHRCFNAQITAFADRCKIIAPDLLGHGESKGYGHLEESPRWLREILAAEDVPDIHLVGVGLGALFAQDFANRFPDYVASLFCCGSYAVADLKNNDDYSGSEFLRAMMQPRHFARTNCQKFCDTAEGQQKIAGAIQSFPKSSWRHFANLRRFLKDCGGQPRSYPLAIGVGMDDTSATRGAALAWAAREPQARLILFPDCGRLVPFDHPDLFNRELESFLKDALAHNTENPPGGWPERLFS